MRNRARTSSHRRSHVLAFLGFFLGIFAYSMFLIFAPFFLGPWVLAVAILLGLGVVLWARRHVRHRNRIPHVDHTLGWKRSTREREPSLALEITLTFVFGTFVGLLICIAIYVQLRYPPWGPHGDVWLIGGAFLLLANYLAFGLLAERDPRYAMGIPWVVDDTTDDT